MAAGFIASSPITPVLAGGGPGGIGEVDGTSSLKLWLKADAGVYQDLDCINSAVNGYAAACWTDQSGYGNHVTRGTDGSPSYETDVVNGKPALRFVEEYMMAADAETWKFLHDGSDHSAFIVWQTASSDPLDQYYLMGTAHTTRHNGFAFSYNDSGNTENQIKHRIMKGTPGNYLLSHSADNIFSAGAFGIAAFRFDDGAAEGDGVIYVNGAAVSSANTDATPSSSYPTATLGIGSDGDGHHPITGDIAEVIVYTSALNPIERTHVDLYLMDKYDIDLSGAGLYASTYNMNVRGISQGAGVPDSGSSAGLTITNVDFLADTDDVLVFGHNVADNTGTLADIPIGFGSRWSRVWYVVKNDQGANGGLVRLVFDFGEAGDTAYDGNTYHLLTRDGTSGDFDSVRTTTTVSGDQVIFDNVDVSLLGPYFTLGRPPVLVTITNDEMSPNSNCSLREAIRATNDDAAYGGCKAGSGADTIALSSNTYALTRSGAGEDGNWTGDLDIADTLSIVGTGSDLTTVDGNALDRVFDIQPGVDTVVISGMTISDGSVNGNGGGISDDDTDLTLINTVVSDSSANSGGGVYIGSGSAMLNNSEIRGSTAYYGGGLYIASGSVTLNGGQIQNNLANTNGGGVYIDQASGFFTQANNSTIALNSADSGGGVYVRYGGMTLETGQILDNTATSGNGGGIHVTSGSATVNSGEINANSASSNGGGVYIFEGAMVLRGGQIVNNTAAAGGGVYVNRSNGSFIQNQDAGSSAIAHNSASFGGGVYVKFGNAIVSDGQIRDNNADYYGGGVYVEEGHGVWTGGQIAANTTGDDGGGIYNTGAMMLNNVPIFDNISGPTNDDGGGIHNRGSMALNDVQVYGNTATMYGGGIYNYDGGVLMIDDSVINDNTTGSGGGGLYSANATLALAAVQVLDNNSNLDGGGLYLLNSDATLTGNTISRNTASQNGGGLYLNASDDALINNIVANNHADGKGSALYSYSSANPQLLHNTIVENTGDTGIHVNGSGTMALSNNILVDHTTAIHVEAGSASLQATLWDGNATPWSGVNITRSDDRYGAPAFEDAANDDYHLIPWFSAATDAGIDAGVSDDFDGAARPQGAGFDIGAFEGPETGLSIVKTVNANLVVPGHPITFTLVYTNHGPGTAAGVLITDVINSNSVVNYSYDSTGATLTPIGGVDYIWLVQDMDPGEGGVIVVSGEIAMGLPAGHTFTNNAAITTSPTESVPENNTDEVEITVSLIANTPDDELNSDGDCSLREAIQAANTDSVVDACAAGDGDDTIILSAGTYALALAGANEDGNATGDLDITAALAIAGTGPGQTIIDADSIDRVLDIRPGAGTVVISGATIINGDVTGFGGGIYNSDANLDLVNAVIRENAATGGGGVYVASGSATLSSGQIVANSATNGGGLYVAGGDATLNGGQIVANSATNGGGLYVAGGGATLNGGQIQNNSVTGDGSGIYNANGAITHATLMTIIGDIYQSNGTFGGGSVLLALQGSLHIEGGAFTAPGELEITGDLIHNAGSFVHNNGTVTFNGSSAQSILGDNTFYNLTIDNASAGVDASGGTLTVDNLLRIHEGMFASSSDYHHVQIDSGATLGLSAAVTVSGDWTNNGTFAPNGHTITLDGVNQTITGDTTFYNLDKFNSPATLTFVAGDTQTIINRLDLRGAGDGSRISLRSTVNGTYWNIDPRGSRTIAYMDVKDSRNVNAAVIAAHATNGVDSGNNPGWNFHFPVANDVELATDEDTPAPGVMDASDDDTGDTLVYAIFTRPISGALTLTDAATGSFSYIPTNQTLTYTDTFDYIVTDIGNLTGMATVTIVVTADNDPPVANDDSGEGYITDENTPFTTYRVLDNDTDIDTPNSELSVVDVSSALASVSDGNGDGRLDYDPRGPFEYLAVGEQTTDIVTYVVSDGEPAPGGPLTDTATAAITIHGVNDAPVANDATLGADEDTPVSDSLDTSDVDDSDTLIHAILSDPVSGTLTLADAVTGSFVYIPSNRVTTYTDAFTYVVTDTWGVTDTATVTIVVTADNDQPVANDDGGAGYATDEDSPTTTGNVLGNDTDVDIPTVLSVDSFDTSLTDGLVTNNSDGTFDYTPNGQFEYLAAGEQDIDTFTYDVRDDVPPPDGPLTDTATVTIIIHGVNDPPTAVGDNYTTTEDDTFTTGNVLDNDTDPDVSNVLSLAHVDTSAATGIVINNGDGTFGYIPDGQFEYLNVGEQTTDTFAYIVTDGTVTDTTTVTITINGVNDAPIANADSYIIIFNTPLHVPAATGVLANDFDIEDDILTATLDSPPTGTLSFKPDGSFVYTPTLDSRAPDFFTYYASDPYTDSNIMTVTLYVLDKDEADLGLSKNVNNSLPNEGDTIVYTLQATSNGITDTTGVVISDTLPDGVSHAGDSGGGKYDKNTGVWTIGVLNDGYSATLRITATVDMGTMSDAITNTAVISNSDRDDPIFVNDTASVALAVNVSPVASGDIYTTGEDNSTITGNVLGNDTDLETPDYLLSLDDFTTAITGLVSSIGGGVFAYDPNGQFEYLAVGEQSTDTFTYVVADAGGLTDTATVTIIITGVNDAPTAFDDGGDGYITDEDTPFTTADVRENDTDPDTTDSRFAALASDTLGLVSDNGNGDGTFDFDPRGWYDHLIPGEKDVYSFTYVISDTGNLTDTATVTITITGVNDTPTAVDDKYSTDEDTPFSTGEVLTNDTDPDIPDTLFCTLLDPPISGAVTITNAATGGFIYTPTNQMSTYTDTFTYIATDSGSLTSEATVTIVVTADNDPPVANDDSGEDYITDEDTLFTTPNVLDNDTDIDTPDGLSAEIISGTVGPIVDNGDDTFDFDPTEWYEYLALGEQGVFSFTYVVSDGILTDTASVTIIITGANDAPLAWNDTYTTGEDAPFTTGNVLDNDIDPDDSDTLSWVSFDAISITGLITATGGGVFDYDPNGQFEHLAVGRQALETFTYVATDNAVTTTATATIIVEGVNDPPLATNDSYFAIYETPQTIPVASGVLTNDFDIDGDTLTATLNISPTGTLNLAPDGSFVYTPTSNFRGMDTFSYYASDGYTGSNVVSVTIYVFLPIEVNLAMSKDVNDTTPKEGDTIVYTLQVTNNGITDTTGVVVSDTLPSGVHYVASSGDGVYDANTGDWAAGALNNGDSALHYITVTVDVGTTGVTITNVAVASSDRNDPIPDNDAASAIIIPIPPGNSDLEMGQDVDDLTPTTGDTFVYMLRVTNNGPAGNTGVVVSDTLPGGVSYVADNGNGDYDHNTGVWTVGALSYSESVTLHITTTMNIEAVGVIITNTAVISASDRNDHIPGNGTASVGVTVNSPPIANDDSGAGYSTGEGAAFTTANVMDNDIDPDAADTLSVVDLDTSSTLGLVVDNGDGTFGYAPNGQFEFLAADDQITDSFMYTVSDSPLTDTATVTVIITGVNDGPTISEIPNQSVDGGATVGPISFTIDDVDTLVQALTLECASSNAALVPTTTITFGGSGADRTVTITPTAGMKGITTITIAVSDGEYTAYDTFELAVDEYRIYVPLVVRNS